MTNFASGVSKTAVVELSSAGWQRVNGISNTHSYTITVARSLAEIDMIRDVWQQFSRHLAVDIDYYLTVNELQESVVRPHVVVFYDAGEPVAMLIGSIVDSPLPLTLGYRILYAPTVRSLHISYGGALGVDSPAIARAMLEEVNRTLVRKEAEMADLNFLKSGSTMHSAARSLTRFFSRDHVHADNRHYELLLPDSFDAYLRSRSRNTRANVQRYSRRLKKKYGARLSIVQFRDEKDIDCMLTDIEAVAKKTYQRGLLKGLGDNEPSRRLTSLAARRGWLRVHILYIDGSPCAFWAGYLHRGTFLIDIPGYDPDYSADRLGHFLFMKVVEELCEDPLADRIDFGFGDAQYKRSFGTDYWQEHRVLIFAPTVKGALLNMIRTGVVKTEALVRLVLERTRLLNLVKSRWRNHIRLKR